MADQIRVGEIVQLKSGSPSMTVDSIYDDWGVSTAACSWFDGKSIKKNNFPISSLAKVGA